MKKRQAERHKNSKPSRAPRRKKTFTKIACGWCHKVIAKGNAWSGDIEAAIWLDAPIRKGSRTLCGSCAEQLPAMVEPAVQRLNRFRPELRLECPSPPTFLAYLDSTFKPGPIPNLKVCADFFFECRSARCGENAGKLLGDILLRFEREHPMEWRCSGWKNDFIAELVLGHSDCGKARERKVNAEYWFSRHWKDELRFERKTPFGASESQGRARWAAIELEYLKSNHASHLDRTVDSGVAKKTPIADSESSATPAPSHGLRDALKTLRNVPHPRGESYNTYVGFVRWWDMNSALGTNGGVIKFRKEHPHSRLTTDAMKELIEAYDQCLHYLGESQRSKYALDPSRVILECIARRHGVSPRLVAEARAHLRREMHGSQ